jgi:hypothetical protein
MFDHPLYHKSNIEYQLNYSKLINQEIEEINVNQENFEFISTSDGNYYGLPSILYLKCELAKSDRSNIIEIIRPHINKPRFNLSLRGIQDEELVAKLIIELGLQSSLLLIRSIRLNQPLALLRSSFRKSYKSLINQQKKNISSKVLYAESFNSSDWEGFRRLHIESAKRETRSRETWDIQASNIISGNAYAIVLLRGSEIIAGGYFLLSDKSVYYGVAASARDNMGALVGSHLMIFNAIEFAQHLNKAFFIISEDDISYLDEKVRNIMKYKYGFGGETEIMYNISNR